MAIDIEERAHRIALEAQLIKATLEMVAAGAKSYGHTALSEVYLHSATMSLERAAAAVKTLREIAAAKRWDAA